MIHFHISVVERYASHFTNSWLLKVTWAQWLFESFEYKL